MNGKAFKAITGLMWLALPLTAIRFSAAWNRLPLRMATHFSITGQPNGWMPRELALYFALGITALMLAIFTVVSYVAHKNQIPDASSWALLGFFYLMIGFVYAVNSSVVQHNLDGRPLRIDFWIIFVPVAIVAIAAISLGTKRGDSLPVGTVLAEEEHGSRAWSLLFVALLLSQLSAVILIPVPSIRLGSTLLALLFAVIAVHVWTGFHYFFTTAGVEIRTLGFRLRSIPRADIKEYAVESWNPLRGYGIRGIGNRRAYVWCNSGVRIQTTEGEVFLGHTEPDCVVRDLNSITLNPPG
jgi:hypothetical protein